MTTRLITAQLLKHRHHKGWAFPNYTPKGWYECDVLYVRDSGMSDEYEVKVSQQDFDADVNKRRCVSFMEKDRYTKHERLENPEGALWSPNRFWFVTPAMMLGHDDIPEWAGWIEMDGPPEKPYEVLQKMAPTRHRTKIDPDVLVHARGVCYWRMHKLLQERRLE